MTLGWILAASVAGGTLSAGLAAASLALRATWVPMLVSFAIGALLGIVAASMIHVAVADLIPGLHRKPELRDTASQALLIALGIGAIAVVGVFVPH
jgi:zinc and cadmium transporter